MGTLSLTDAVNGTTADASLVNGNNTNLKTVINGGIQTVNLASGHAEFVTTQSTTSVTVAITTEASATTVLTFANTLFDGSPVVVEFDAPSSSITAGNKVTVCLFEGATEIGQMHVEQNQTASTQLRGIHARHRFTPSAATHTYSVAAFKDGGTCSITGGAGGTGLAVPIQGRIVKA